MVDFVSRERLNIGVLDIKLEMEHVECTMLK